MLVARKRVFEALQRGQGIAAVDQRIDVMRIEPERRIVARDGLVQSPQRGQRHTTVVVRRRECAVDAQGGVDPANRGVVVAALRRNDARHVQAVEMRRLRRQDLLINLFGVTEPTSLMQ